MSEQRNPKHYIGSPCKYGHDGLRYKSTGNCVYCNRKASYNSATKWRKENPEKHRERVRDYYQRNKEKRSQYNKKYNKENRALFNYHDKKRRNNKRNATPPWFEEDKVAVIYEKAAEMGSEVDHIVPLVSDKVCGLHCWDNLQILPVELNRAKKNYFWPDM